MRYWILLLVAGAAWAQGLPLDCGQLKDGTANPLLTDFYNINNAVAGDAMILRLLVTAGSAPLRVNITLVDRANHVVAARAKSSPSITTGASYAAEFDLNTDGPYQIQVQNTGQGPVSYRLVYTWLNKACTGPALACGVSTTGQISAALELKSHQFAAKQGDAVSVRLARVGTAAKGFDAAMFLYTPAGQLFAALDTGKSGLTAANFQAPADGTFTILVFDTAGTTGGYALMAARLGGPNGGCGSQSLGCGTAAQGRISSPLNVDTYPTARLLADDVVSIRLTATDKGGSLVPAAMVFDPQGQPVAVETGKLPVSGRVIYSAKFTAAGNGVFTVVVQDAATALDTGGYAVSMALLNRPCDRTSTLACGAATDGTLSGLMATNSYALAANSNDRFLLRLLNTTQNSAFTPRLEIYDGRGNSMQTLTTGDLARQTFTAPATGTYTAVVSDAFDASQSGSYTVALLRLNGACGASAGTLSCGTLTPGTFARPLDTPAYSYTAAAGQSFTLRMVDNTGGLQEALEVYDAQGNLAGQAVTGGYAGVDVANPAGGTYTVVAMDNSRRPAGGAFGIELFGTATGCGQAAPQGQTVSGVVSASRPFAAYSIPASAGDTLVVRSASFTPGFAAQMDLYDPSGTRLDSATFGMARKAAASGNYTLILGAVAPRSAGGYALAWQLANHPAGTSALACGGTTSAALTASNEFRYYTASAAAGDAMRLIFTKLSDNFSPQVELYDPNGTRLATSGDIAQKAGADGDYLVTVGPSTSNGETGTFSLAYQRPNRPCWADGQPATLTCGQTTLRMVKLPGQLDTFTFDGTGGDATTLTLAPRTGSYTPLAELYDGNGARLATNASGLLRLVLPASGTYALLVRDLNAVNTGSYRVSLQDNTKPCAVSDTESPTIRMVQPTGGEAIAGGTTYWIRWQSDDNVGVTSHDVALSTDGGQTFAALLPGALSGTAQSVAWAVPADIAPSRNAVIRVTATDTAGNAQSAASGPVTIIGSGFTPNSTAAYTYDALNRLTQAVMGDGRTIQYTWDAAGNLVQITVQ